MSLVLPSLFFSLKPVTPASSPNTSSRLFMAALDAERFLGE
jgi:hypothetical protein